MRFHDKNICFPRPILHHDFFGSILMLFWSSLQNYDAILPGLGYPLPHELIGNCGHKVFLQIAFLRGINGIEKMYRGMDGWADKSAVAAINRALRRLRRPYGISRFICGCPYMPSFIKTTNEIRQYRQFKSLLFETLRGTTGCSQVLPASAGYSCWPLGCLSNDASSEQIVSILLSIFLDAAWLLRGA